MSKGPRPDTAEMIRRFKSKHGDTYDYSLFRYTNSKVKATIICRLHGPFDQHPHTHVQGVGCPICGREKTNAAMRQQAGDVGSVFVAKSVEVHGKTYNYSKTQYTTAKRKVCITCPDHGDFWQVPYNHLKGHGCPGCSAAEASMRETSTVERMAKTANERHNNKYTYDKVVYKSATKKIEITCPKHGSFWLTPNVHLTGIGCPTCTIEEGKTRDAAIGQAAFAPRASVLHKNKYDYSLVEYIDYETPVKIICPKHGVFTQTPDSHMQGCGCQKCSGGISIRENDLAEFVRSMYEIKTRDRKLLKGKELDIFIPERNIAFEYNGSLFHSECYHGEPKWHLKNKQDICDNIGIRLIHISDYEDQNVIKEGILNVLGKSPKKTFARKCNASESSHTEEIDLFLNSHHLQGSVKGCRYFLLHCNYELVSVMAFSKVASERGVKNPNRWELRRFCSDGRVVGGASKLLKAFLRSTPECESIISYSDNKWFSGGMYEKLGFKKTKDLPPDYKYVCKTKNMSVKHKGQFRRANLLKRPDIVFDPTLTEVENCHANGWYRVWDCGKKKWELAV